MTPSSRHISTQTTPWRLIRHLALFALLLGNIFIPELHHALHGFVACDEISIAMDAGEQFLTAFDSAKHPRHDAERCPLCQFFAQLFSIAAPGAPSCRPAPALFPQPFFYYQAAPSRVVPRSCQSRAPPILAATC
ncbi:MAG: DUF2946 family protein [Lentisphaeria bacterium]